MIEFALVLILAGFSIALIFTADRWLMAALNILDRFLVKLGVGTWLAKLLTAAENWVAARTVRKAERKNPGSREANEAHWLNRKGHGHE
jgi:hypothetical protein